MTHNRHNQPCLSADEVYLDIVKHVLARGVRKSSRTGIDTLSVFSIHYVLDISDNFPLLTTKEMNWAAIIHELLWYLSGENHIRNLRQHTKIWDDWADADGNLDTAYGYYWRHFPSAEKDENGAWHVREVDQIRHVINTLKTDPNSRRMVVVAWEPGNAISSRLPPCHYTFVFSVSDTDANIGRGTLNCHLTQRSGDIALGIPFNMAAYAALTRAIAQECGLKPGLFSHTIVDAHIYVNHIDGLKEQLTRVPYNPPRLLIADKPVDALTFDDFRIIDYKSHPAIRFPVAV